MHLHPALTPGAVGCRDHFLRMTRCEQLSSVQCVDDSQINPILYDKINKKIAVSVLGAPLFLPSISALQNLEREAAHSLPGGEKLRRSSPQASTPCLAKAGTMLQT